MEHHVCLWSCENDDRGAFGCECHADYASGAFVYVYVASCEAQGTAASGVSSSTMFLC